MSYVWQPLTPPPDAKTISEFSEEAETVWKYILNRYSEKKPRPPPDSTDYYAALYQRGFQSPFCSRNNREMPQVQSRPLAPMWPFTSQSSQSRNTEDYTPVGNLSEENHILSAGFCTPTQNHSSMHNRDIDHSQPHISLCNKDKNDMNSEKKHIFPVPQQGGTMHSNNQHNFVSQKRWQKNDTMMIDNHHIWHRSKLYRDDNGHTSNTQLLNLTDTNVVVPDVSTVDMNHPNEMTKNSEVGDMPLCSSSQKLVLKSRDILDEDITASQPHISSLSNAETISSLEMNHLFSVSENSESIHSNYENNCVSQKRYRNDAVMVDNHHISHPSKFGHVDYGDMSKKELISDVQAIDRNHPNDLPNIENMSFCSSSQTDTVLRSPDMDISPPDASDVGCFKLLDDTQKFISEVNTQVTPGLQGIERGVQYVEAFSNCSSSPPLDLSPEFIPGFKVNDIVSNDIASASNVYEESNTRNVRQTLTISPIGEDNHAEITPEICATDTLGNIDLMSDREAISSITENITDESSTINQPEKNYCRPIIDSHENLRQTETTKQCQIPQKLQKLKKVQKITKRQSTDVVKPDVKRKKQKTNFSAPYKPITNFVNQPDEDLSTPKTSPLQKSISLTEEERGDLSRDIMSTGEVALSLLYADGTSQLRELPEVKQRRKEESAPIKVTGLAIAYPKKEDMSAKMSYILIDFDDKDKSGSYHKWSREFLSDLMSAAKIQKLCFDSQEMIQRLLEMFNFNTIDVVRKWKVMDPKVAVWLLDPDHPAVRFTQVLDEVKDLKQANSKSTRDELICWDLDLLGPLMLQLYQRLCEDGMWPLFTAVEMPLIPVLAVMETRSVRIDTECMLKSLDLVKKKMSQLEKACHQAAGHPFALNSHPQLRQVLFEELQLDLKLSQNMKMHRTAVRNQKSTSEAVLTHLQDLHPLPKLVLEHRQLQKLKSTYMDGIMTFVEKGFLHTCWDQTSAATGRLSSTNPNIQSVPKVPICISLPQDTFIAGRDQADVTTQVFARAPFVSREGYSFIAVDFQQIELRLLAHLSQDPCLLRVFHRDDSHDIFIQLTSQWLNIKTDAVTQTDREKTKRIVYSVMYGVGKEKLSEYLKTSPEEAKCIMNSFLITFPGVNKFTRICVEQARKQGFQTTIFSRRRLLPHINISNSKLRSQSERQAVNFCIQGSAADLCKAAMIQVEHALADEAHLDAKLLYQIHDELLLEVKDESCSEVAGLVTHIMESKEGLCGNKIQLTVPLTVSLTTGKSWSHMSDLNVNASTE